MDFQQAIKILEIDLNKIKKKDLTHDYIRKKFHKLALLNHPDKKGDTKRFQEINEAYSFLLKELDLINCHYETNTNTFSYSFSPSSSFESENIQTNLYVNLLTAFIEGIINATFTSNKDLNSKASYKYLIIDIIKKILLSEASLEKIFENLEKETSLEIYNFIFKYKNILHIDDKLVSKIDKIIKEKHLNKTETETNEPNRIFYLTPSLNDVLDSNLYKLYVDNQLYLVPLWHNELYFDTSLNNSDKGDIVVLCNPILPENISIDEDNNIHIIHKLAFDTIKESLTNNIDTFNVQLGNKILKVTLSNLYIKKEQEYIFKYQGISQIVENDMYNISNKSDVIVKIILV